MIRIVVCGALGRMGKLCVERINSADDLEIVAQVDVAGDGETVLTSLERFSGTADIVIDFSFHTATPGCYGLGSCSQYWYNHVYHRSE